jgi:hypothetical protein
VARTLERLRLIDGVSEVTLQTSSEASGGSDSAASSAKGCTGPSFAIQLTFEPLPASGAAASVQPAASTGGAG